jgi:hypothetical protein
MRKVGFDLNLQLVRREALHLGEPEMALNEMKEH